MKNKMELVQDYGATVDARVKEIDILIGEATDFIVKNSEHHGAEITQRRLHEDPTIRELRAIKVKIYTLAIPHSMHINYQE